MRFELHDNRHYYNEHTHNEHSEHGQAEAAMVDFTDVSELPDDLAELARQLGEDAHRLSGCYPARIDGSEPSSLPSDAATRPATAPRRSGSRWIAWKVAAAVGVLGGLTLIVSGWHGFVPSDTSKGPAMAGSNDRAADRPLLSLPGGAPALGSAHAGTAQAGPAQAGVVQPTFISTDALQQLSGEKIEILADSPGRHVADI